MGRPSRFRLPGIPQLITQRGHNRLPCFLDGEDFTRFKEILTFSAELAACDVEALLMLPNAYWVLAKPGEKDSVARLIQRTGRCYVRYCNEKYRREGTMWASRYRACLIEPHPDSLRDCISFLEHTPAKSGVVAPGAAWPWLFLDSKHSAGKSKRDEQHFEAVSSALEKGLVYGGTNFRKKIAAQAGIRTEPGRRGRPPIHRESGMAKNDGGA